MPLRGALFKRIFATKKQREQIEKRQLAQEFRKKSQALAKLKGTRIKEQGRAKLRSLLADEKRQLKAARSTTKRSRFERFLKKETQKGVAFGLKEARKKFKKKSTRKRGRKGKRGRPRKRKGKR